MYVKVFKLGEEADAIAVFQLGAYVVGRGPVLQCNDKRVSRNHATIEVTEGAVKITSNHVNPCFIKIANSKTVTILEKDQTFTLNDNDNFALLPDDYWFKINIVEEDGVKLEVPEQSLKRQLAEIKVEENEEAPEKRQKIDNNNDTTEITAIENNVVPSTSHADVKTEIPEEAANTTAENLEPKEDDDVKVEETAENEPKEPETSGTSPSTSKPRRERCWYGAECYRNNPAHRQDFTHPGDSDYATDPEDDRPSCGFGAACYRKSLQHRRDYKHPPGKPQDKLPKKRTRKKVRPDYSDDDLSDMSEDPFIDDGDSDEYVQDSDDEDSDEESQNVDEDSENMRRLVKEANRFITKK